MGIALTQKTTTARALGIKAFGEEFTFTFRQFLFAGYIAIGVAQAVTVLDIIPHHPVTGAIDHANATMVELQAK